MLFHRLYIVENSNKTFNAIEALYKGTRLKVFHSLALDANYTSIFNAQPCAIVIDYSTVELTGFSFLKLIRSNEITTNTPVFFINTIKNKCHDINTNYVFYIPKLKSPLDTIVEFHLRYLKFRFFNSAIEIENTKPFIYNTSSYEPSNLNSNKENVVQKKLKRFVTKLDVSIRRTKVNNTQSKQDVPKEAVYFDTKETLLKQNTYFKYKPVCVVNENAELLNYNSSYVNFFSDNPKSKSVKIGDLSPIISKDIIQGYIQRLFHSYKPYRIFTTSYSTAKNEKLWLSITLIPVVTINKANTSFICSIKTVSFNELVAENERLHLLMEESIKLKDMFVANMSHEIRTPLNVILGYTDLLLESKLHNEQSTQLKTIKKSGKHLLSIINDILDLSKLESGKLTLDARPFDIIELLASVKNMLAVEAEKKGLVFSLEIKDNVPNYVTGDITRTEQILVNIISNAIKFTKKGFVKIKVDIVNKNNYETQIRFKVSDTGIGIPKNKQATIFDSFTQSSSYITREFGGTGLGLTIVKKLVNLLDGYIQITSEEAKGTDFYVTIPFLIPSSKELNDNKIPLIASHNNTAKGQLYLNILLVEDNEHNQLLTKTRLNSWHCDVDTAANGLEAIEMLKKNDYHLILMDIQMPIMDGYKATKYIRKKFTNYKSEIPIIALSASASNEEAKKAIEFGFNDYLFKPFNLKLLFNCLRKYGNLAVDIEQLHPAIIEDSTNVSNEIEDEPIVNFDFIESEALGYPNIINLLITSFLEEFTQFINNVEKAIDNKNWDKIHQAAHKISPTVNAYQLKTILPYLNDLLVKSKNQTQTNNYSYLISEIKKEYKKVEPLFLKKTQDLEKTIMLN